MQYFHQGATNRDSSSRLQFTNMRVRQNWEDLFLRAVYIIRSVRQDLNLWSKNIKSDLSIAVSMSFSNKLTPPWIFWISKGRSAATNACRLIHGMHLDYRKTFLVINFLRLMRTEIILKEFILSHHKERRSVPQATRSVTLFARDDKQNRGTISMPTLAARPSTMRSTIPVKSRQNSMVGQQISELQFDKFPNPQSFLVWKYDSKIKWPLVLIFHQKRCYGSKKWRWLIHWRNWSPRDPLLERIFQIWDAGRQDCICPEQDHPEFPIQAKGQSGGTQSPERGSVSSRKTDCLHDLRRLSSHWCSWHSSWLPRFILCYSSWR